MQPHLSASTEIKQMVRDLIASELPETPSIPDTTFLDVEEGTLLRGVVSVHFDGPVPTIANLAVVPQFRKRGIGSDLLHHAEQCIREAGFKHAKLWCSDDMRGFYARRRYCRMDRISHGGRAYNAMIRNLHLTSECEPRISSSASREPTCDRACPEDCRPSCS